MKILGKFVVIVLFEVITNIPCLSNDIPLPKGWRNPTNLEIKNEWRNKDINRYLWIEADFNGDGVMDKASLLIRTNGDGLGLCFCITKRRNIQNFLLDERRTLIISRC